MVRCLQVSDVEMKLHLSYTLLLMALVLFCLLEAGCGGDELAQSEWERLAAIRAEAESCWSEYQKALFGLDVLGDSSSWEGWTASCRSVYSVDNISLLRRIETHLGNAPESRRVALLRQHLTDVLDLASVWRDYYGGRGPNPEYDLDCKHPFVSKQIVDRGVSCEPDRRIRQDVLYDPFYNDALGRCFGHLTDLYKLEDSLLASLEYGTTLSFLMEAGNIDTNRIMSLVEEILAETDSLYEQELRAVCAASKDISLERLQPHDLLFMGSLCRFETGLTADSTLMLLDSALAQIGLAVSVAKDFRVHYASDLLITTDALPYAVSIPDDIRFVISSGPLWMDQYAHLRELGIGLMYHYTSMPDFESKYLGDNSATEAFASFFTDLLRDRADLKRFMLSDPNLQRDASGVADFAFLTNLRRLCAQVDFELAFYGGTQEPEETFREIWSRALRIDFPAWNKFTYLMATTRLACADQLRGHILAAMLRSKLRTDFGEGYMQDPRTGAFLKDLWRQGHSLSVEQMTAMLGYEELTIEPLLNELRAAD